MPTGVFAGIHRNSIPRFRPRLETLKVHWPDWDFFFLPCGNSGGFTADMVTGALEFFAQKQGPHVFGVSAPGPAGRGRETVAQKVRAAFRFRWMPDDFSGMVEDAEIFNNVMAGVLEEETFWRDNIMPSSCHHALVLPTEFSAHTKVAAIWQRSESYNNIDLLKRAERDLQLFASLHRAVKGNAKAWKDERNLLWDDYGAHHGEPQFPHGWKYSCLLPEKFHFDVEHAHSKGFEYRCAGGRSFRRKGSEHLNVNAHGFVC